MKGLDITAIILAVVIALGMNVVTAKGLNSLLCRQWAPPCKVSALPWLQCQENEK